MSRMRAAVPGFRLRLRPSHRAASHPAGAGGITALVRQRGWPGFKVRGFGRWPILQSRASRLIPGDRSPGVTGHLAHDPRQRAVVHGKPTIDRLAGADRVNEPFLLGEMPIFCGPFLAGHRAGCRTVRARTAISSLPKSSRSVNLVRRGQLPFAPAWR